jgi:hypothetical protein
MRGGVTMHELMHVYTHEDIMIMSDIIKENVENTKTSGMSLV